MSSMIRSPWSGRFDCRKPLRRCVSVDWRGISSRGTPPASGLAAKSEFERLADQGNCIVAVVALMSRRGKRSWATFWERWLSCRTSFENECSHRFKSLVGYEFWKSGLVHITLKWSQFVTDDDKRKNIVITFRQRNMSASIFSTGKKIEVYILALLHNADVRLSWIFLLYFDASEPIEMNMAPYKPRQFSSYRNIAFPS